MLVLVALCGCDPSECKIRDDCPSGQFCVYLQGEDNRCVTPCVVDPDTAMLSCPEGQRCVMRGSSCEGCEDLASFCE